MTSGHRLWLLSALGITAVGCQAGAGEAAATDESAVGEEASEGAAAYYFASLAYRALPVPLAREVRTTLLAVPGAASRGSLIALLTTPKFFELVRASGPEHCAWHGDQIALRLVAWTKDVARTRDREDARTADVRAARAIDDAKQKLDAIDTSDLEKAAAALATGRFDVPGCADRTNNTATETTSYAMLAPGAEQQEMAADAASVLADLFIQADAVAPSRAMSLEWSSLKARFHAGMTKADRSLATAALRDARRLGSATLARDAHAGRRFDEAARLVDAFARGGIAPSVDAMNVLHAAVATEHGGQMRAAGQNVSSGRRRERLYLPGAAVAAATTKVFADMRARRANGESAPSIAAAFDQRLISVHPYMDANGRTTRLMTDWLLVRDGFPPTLATNDVVSSGLLWERGRVVPSASLEQITLGMRRTVELVEAIG